MVEHFVETECNSIQDICILYLYHWFQLNKAEKVESYIHTGIAKAISSRCKCKFPVTFIRSGIFHCWNTPDEVTYRSVMVSPGRHKATQLLHFLEEWVDTKPVLQVEKFGLWVSTECPVKISSLGLSDPHCRSFRFHARNSTTT